MLVSFRQRLLKKSVVIQERSCVCSQVWDQIAPSPTAQAQVVKRVACLICDQVEAAFLMSFAAIQACFFFVVVVVVFFTCD